MNNNIIKFPLAVEGTQKMENTMAMASGQDMAISNEMLPRKKDDCKIIPFPKEKIPTVTYIETCAGIGVPSMALRKVGERLGINFVCTAYSEIDKTAIKAYEFVHGPKLVNLGDVTKVDWSKFPCDMLSFTFPCQNISIANRNAKGFEEGEDSTSSIVWSLKDVLTKMPSKPKIIFFENVSAILNKRHKKTLDKLVDYLNDEGYSVSYENLDAADYGVPQHRERVYILATLGCKPAFEFPKPVPLTTKLKDILDEEPSKDLFLKKTKDFFIKHSMETSYTMRVHTPSHCEKAYTITTKSGGRISDNFIFEKDVNNDKVIKIKPKDLKEKGIDIETIKNMPIRKLSPREVMKLTGLDDDVMDKLKELRPSQVYQLCGNSIVEPVLEEVFYEYFKVLKNEGYLDSFNDAA